MYRSNVLVCGGTGCTSSHSLLIAEKLKEDIDVVEDDVPEDVPSRVVDGDVWEFGNHRLVCGDCSNPAVIDALMGNELADMLLTDPPYNVDYSNKSNGLAEIRLGVNYEDIQNDTFEKVEDYSAFLHSVFGNVVPSLRDGGAFYIWFAAWFTGEVFEACKQSNLHIRQELYWI